MSEATEPMVGEDALQASLDQLIKAAGAESAVSQLKKGGIVNSGFEDERGKQGGGQASQSDAGGIEEMMIGKMVAGGMSQDAAAALVGFMQEQGLMGRQAAPEGDEDEDEDEGMEGDEEGMGAYARGYYDAKKSMSGKGEPMRKSFAEQFSEDPDLAAGVDASPWLEALTARVTQSLEGLNKSMTTQAGRQNKVNIATAAAIVQMGTLIKSQANVIKVLGQRLNIVEQTPAAPPKGARTLTGAQAMHKSLEANAGGGQGQPLSKSEAASVLSYLRFQKGVADIDGTSTGQLAVFAESGGTLSKSVHEHITKYLATHPNERQAALNYR